MPRARRRSRPTLVLLVRHGHTPTTGKVLPGRAKGLHLSDKGRQQAAAVSERLAALASIDAVFSSPLERTRETATAIAAGRGLQLRLERGLMEADIGEWTGQELKQVRKLPEWKAVQQHPSGFRFPGGESFMQLQARTVAALERLREQHTGGTIVAVSHADPIKAAVVHALGAHLDMFQRVSISPCSVTAIAYADTTPHVLTVNSVGALTDLRPS